MLVQVRPGASKAHSEEEQFPVNHKSTLGTNRRLQNASMGWHSGVPLGDHGVLSTKLLRIIQEQGRSNFN